MSAYPIMIPFFIGGEIDRGLFKGLVIGLALVFMVTPSLAVFVADQNSGGNPCPIIESKDSQAVKTWKQSCYDFEHHLHFDLPVITGSLGGIILIIGYLRLRFSREELENNTVKIEQPKNNRTYPKGYSSEQRSPNAVKQNEFV